MNAASGQIESHATRQSRQIQPVSAGRYLWQPDQKIRDGQGPQIHHSHVTAVGPAPAPVQEESVADSVNGNEDEMTEQVQHNKVKELVLWVPSMHE